MKFIDYFLCTGAISFVIRIICIVLSIFYCFKYDDINILMVIICIVMMFLTLSIFFDCFKYTYLNNDNVSLVYLFVYIFLILSLLSVSENIITTNVLYNNECIINKYGYYIRDYIYLACCVFMFRWIIL
jgi:hypothetical protein